MKCSLGISNFLEEISGLSHPIVCGPFYVLSGSFTYLGRGSDMLEMASPTHNTVSASLPNSALDEVRWEV